MRTRDIVYSISKQPQFAQDLIDLMARKLCDGKQALHIPVAHMTPEKNMWLQREGFEVEYDKRIHEYKINLI